MIEGRDFVFIPHADNPSKRERERATPLCQYTALCHLNNNCQCCLESSVGEEEITAADVDEQLCSVSRTARPLLSVPQNNAHTVGR